MLWLPLGTVQLWVLVRTTSAPSPFCRTDLQPHGIVSDQDQGSSTIFPMARVGQNEALEISDLLPPPTTSSTSFLGRKKDVYILFVRMYPPHPFANLFWIEMLGAAGELGAGVGGHTEVGPEGTL